MFENELKQEIFEKLRQLKDVVQEKNELEDTLEYTYSEIIEDEELVDQHIDYLGLCVLENDLEDEIKVLLLDTKYFPLTGLASSDVKELYRFADLANQGSFEKHLINSLELRLLQLQEEIKERQKLVRPLYLNAHIDKRTHYMYRQVIDCYLYGAYEAASVLSRAIVESLAKKFIEHKGYGHLLVGRKKEEKQMSIQDILRNVLGVEANTIALYTKIANAADNILHSNHFIDNQRVVKSIALLQDFLKVFPRSI